MDNGRRERGAAGLEYVGAVLVAASLAAACLTAFVPAAQPIRHAVTCAANAVLGVGQPCPGGSVEAGTDPAGTVAAGGDRRDAARDARGDRRNDARRGGDGTAPPTGSGGGTPGADQPTGLGPAVPGTTVGWPPPPAWSPPDAGAGEHDSAGVGIADRATEVAAEAAANAAAGLLPHASRNLLHYLGDSGKTFEQDVDAILRDVPAFAGDVDVQRDLLGRTAVANARASGASGPVTMPVSTQWTGFYIGSNLSKDWFYALGGISYSLVGQVTVYPPVKAGEPWRYETTTRVVIRDRYNWDHGKSTQIGPFTVTDDQLAKLHRVGLAQEYTVVGTSDTGTTKGDVP